MRDPRRRAGAMLVLSFMTGFSRSHQPFCLADPFIVVSLNLVSVILVPLILGAIGLPFPF